MAFPSKANQSLENSQIIEEPACKNAIFSTFAKVKLGCLGLSIKMSDIVYVPKKYKKNPFRQPRPELKQVVPSENSTSNASSATSRYAKYSSLESKSRHSKHISNVLNLEIAISLFCYFLFKPLLLNFQNFSGFDAILATIVFYLILGIFISASEEKLKINEKVDHTLSFIILFISKLSHLVVLLIGSNFFWSREIKNDPDQFTGPDILKMTFLSSIGVFGTFKLLTELGKGRFEDQKIDLVLWKLILSCFISGIAITLFGSLSTINEDYQEWSYKRTFGYITFVIFWPLVQLIKLADLIEISEVYRKEEELAKDKLNFQENRRFWQCICIDLVSINYCFISRIVTGVSNISSFWKNKKSEKNPEKVEENSDENLAEKWKADGVYDEEDDDSYEKTVELT